MPAKKKTTVEEVPAAAKPPVKKPAAKKATAKAAEPAPAAPKAKAPKKAAAPKKPAAKKVAAVLSPEERYSRVQMEAYLIAEQNGFAGDDVMYWLQAEKKVAAELG